MVKGHMKTLTAPVSWPIKRKGQKFVVRPKPGKAFSVSMPLALVFKNILKYCKTMKEVKAILQDKEVYVEGKRRKNPKYLLGLMDTLSIPFAKEHYRMLINQSKKLCLVPVPEAETKFKICKITSKTVLKKSKMQLNFFDGKNIIVKEDKYKVGDSVTISLPDNKVKKSLKLEKGNYAFLTRGSHVGEHGLIEEVKLDIVKIKTKESVFETPKEFIYVIGKGKPEITVEQK